MENVLTRLFDFQLFDNNRALQNVIDSVHARYSTRALDLDDLEQVAAAGVPEQVNQAKDADRNRS